MKIEGFEPAPEDWWPEDSVTRALRAATPKPGNQSLVTEDQAERIIDKLIADQRRAREGKS